MDEEQLQRRLHDIAGELRSPLAVSFGAAEMLAELLRASEPDLEHIADIVTVLRRETRLASKLLDRLRLAGEVRDDSLSLTTHRFDLVRMVEEIVADLSAFVMRQPVTVTHNGALPGHYDAGAVAEIMFNLLDNAARYSPSDAGIAVGVDGVDGQARIVVRDHGPGLPPGDVEQLFDAYAQGRPANAGVGLGLYVSRALARAHGGDLTAWSANGGGSEFVVELPAYPA